MKNYFSCCLDGPDEPLYLAEEMFVITIINNLNYLLTFGKVQMFDIKPKDRPW